MKHKAILFDLDGTLLDTAPDLLSTLNVLRKEHELPPLPLNAFRHVVSDGASAMLELGLAITKAHPTYDTLWQKFVEIYQNNLIAETQLFPSMEEVLVYLESSNIPWGIVTNKGTRSTLAIMEGLKLSPRAACIVCGDTLKTAKPDPATILYACNLINIDPKDVLYVGDALTDVKAAKAAGSKALVALYGYINKSANPLHWGADGYIKHPKEMFDWI